jgi:hypothetical protein
MAYGDSVEVVAARAEEIRRYIRFGIKILVGVVAFILVLVWAWKFASPKYNLYRAETEKRIAVEEARATKDSAVLLAEAEVSRAEGVAEANQIIATSITEDYIRWLYVDQLDRIQGQIIYIPTEAGLPILEANRLEGE